MPGLSNLLGRNVRFESPIPLVSNESSIHRTFMDTVGRATVKLSAVNVVDEVRDQDVIVVYEYSSFAALRKPITIFAGIFSVFVTAWVIGKLDVSIGKPH